MKISGAELTIKLLEKEGIDLIAGIPGGANLPLYSALSRSGIRHILARHEQGACFIAHGIARSTGRTAVCFATSGPGAANLLTAIADAKMDSVPIVAITGQVPSHLIGTDAFQEIDVYGMTVPITKHNFLVRSAAELSAVIPEAFRIASGGRPGPVLIDIPKDVQLETIDIIWDEAAPARERSTVEYHDTGIMQKAADMINEAKRPILYIGGGIVMSDAHEELIEFSEKSSIPVTSTLMGLGCFPNDNDLYIGMLGMHGQRYTNYLLQETDLLLAFGTRFDDRATGKVAGFCPGARIIHIDIDASEINKIKKADLMITCDIKSAMKEMMPMIKEDSRKEWNDRVNDMKKKYRLRIPEVHDPLSPYNIITEVADISGEDAVITTDVGQHQMWVAQYYPFNKPRRLLTSGGLGTMGFGLPAAIGAGLADPSKKIICFSGDGSILMNIQEMATLYELDLDVKIIIFNNRHLGLVRQQQEYFYNKEYIATQFHCSTDFKKISDGFGIESYDLGSCDDPSTVLKNAIKKRGPVLINIPLAHEKNVIPMVAPGGANHEMIGGEINV